MLRRKFLLTTPGAILSIGLAVSGCTMTGASDATSEKMDSVAASTLAWIRRWRGFTTTLMVHVNWLRKPVGSWCSRGSSTPALS